MTIKIGANKHELTDAFVMVSGVKRQIVEIKVPTVGGNKSVWTSEMTLAKLPVGARVKYSGSKYYNKEIIYIKLEDGHYGNNETTLLSEKIICLKAYDAQEPKNPDYGKRIRGNNRYIYSNIQQWLNSTASTWYTSQHSYDEPPSSSGVVEGANAYQNEKGFLSNATSKFRDLMLPTKLQAAKHEIDGGGADNFTAKVFLLSAAETGTFPKLGDGTKFKYFDTETNLIAKVTKECVDNNEYPDSNLKPGVAWYWATRTANRGSDQTGKIGRVSKGYSGYAPDTAWASKLGIRPACTVPKTTKISDKPDSDGCYILLP